MHAAIDWTINDFPAYANLSGWSTKGYKACPCCRNGASSFRLLIAKNVAIWIIVISCPLIINFEIGNHSMEKLRGEVPLSYYLVIKLLPK